MNGLPKPARVHEKINQVALACVCVMLTGLLFSRALLSCGLVAFLLAALCQNGWKPRLIAFTHTRLFWSLLILVAVPLASGIWSSDVHEYGNVMRVKIPLLLTPIAFGCYRWTDRDAARVGFLFIAVTIIGVGWSLGNYLLNMPAVHAAYLRAQTLQTPMGNDHVRFGVLVAVAVAGSAVMKQTATKRISVLLTACIVLFVVYLHLLAARTGLACFYLFILFTIAQFIQRSIKKALLYGVLLIALPVTAYFLLPTFQNRIHYLLYDSQKVLESHYVHGSNDGNRLLSIKAGLRIMKLHPFTGVGAGDIHREMDSIYNEPAFPEDPTDRILPSSEWIMYGAAAGWPGFVLFSIAVILPAFSRPMRKRSYWVLINLFFIASYAFDIGLEVQYGIFLHAFTLAWWYSWLRRSLSNGMEQETEYF